MRVDGAVVRCPVPVTDLPDAPHSGVLWRAAPGRLLLDIPDVARYLISDGNLVEINPRDGVDAEAVLRFLPMTPAAALYLQRGVPVLHASVVADAAGRAVMLAGNSGSGKTVLLTALVQRGWGLLTDDLAPVTLDDARGPVAVPTWPEVIPWADGAGPAAAVVWDARFVDEARPISAIWWLGVQGFDSIEVLRVEGIPRFEAFSAMAYNRRIASALLDRASYLRVCGTVAGSAIPIRRLIRPRGRWTADELADIIEDRTES